MEEKIDLFGFVPEKVVCGKVRRENSVSVKAEDLYLYLSYITEGYNNSKKEFSLAIPRFIRKNKETFEVLGLLQAEMGKTDNGCISFSNHEPRLINEVTRWFEKELELPIAMWRWSIKLNINDPQDAEYKTKIEEKVINYWLSKTKINLTQRYPKAVTYIKNTKNTKLKYYDYGTLVIENKSNLFSQVIKRYVKTMSDKMRLLEKEEIRGYMRGIIAGESCVEVSRFSKKYRVHISATKQEEKDLYENCLRILGIYSKQYPGDKIVISKRKNNTELLKQKLMCLSPEKYHKFLNMIKLYPKISEETGYFTGEKVPHNKHPQELTDKVLELCRQNPDLPCWKIAEEGGVSTIAVARIRKKHNLGRRLTKTSKEIAEKIIKLHNEHPSAYAYEIASQLGIHRARVERVRRKYHLKRGEL